jgi:cell division transport system ATP-binding protein
MIRPAAAMIEFRNAGKSYGRAGSALEGVDLRVNKGEIVVVSGPSGAGKSTLLKLLYAAERPSTGDVLIEGRSVGRLHPHSVPYLRRNLGVVFQDFKLLPRRTVFDNVALALEVCGVRGAELQARVTRALSRVGLADTARRLPGELSGGEQQRAAIARAIVNRPSLVLADEPSGNLDESMADGIFDLLADLSRKDGATVLIATHDRSQVERHGFREIRLLGGRLAEDRSARVAAAAAATAAADALATEPPQEAAQVLVPVEEMAQRLVERIEEQVGVAERPRPRRRGGRRASRGGGS